MPSTLLRGGDERCPPLVCVHSVTGSSSAYAPLARHLRWPGPIVGLDAPAPAGDLPAVPPLAELARRYVDELGGTGPRLLLGWAIGGVIAAEMSQVIAARGGSVRFLGLLDSRAPQPEMRQRPTDRAAMARFFLQYCALTRGIEPGPPPASTEAPALLSALEALGAAGDIAGPEELEARLATFTGLLRSFFHHEQAPVPVDLHLFEAADAHPSHPKPPTLGWEELAPRIHRHVVGGTHFTLMAPERAEALARAIDACL